MQVRLVRLHVAEPTLHIASPHGTRHGLPPQKCRRNLWRDSCDTGLAVGKDEHIFISCGKEEFGSKCYVNRICFTCACILGYCRPNGPPRKQVCICNQRHVHSLLQPQEGCNVCTPGLEGIYAHWPATECRRKGLKESWHRWCKYDLAVLLLGNLGK